MPTTHRRSRRSGDVNYAARHEMKYCSLDEGLKVRRDVAELGWNNEAL